MAMGANSRIEQVIDDIYEFIETCKMQPLSQTKLIVPKDELYDLLDELRLRLPEEIKQYQKIIANRAKLISDAEDKAAEIINQAKEQASQLVSENEISRQAYEHANELVQDATIRSENMLRDANAEAEQLRAGALAYTNDILAEVERVIARAYEDTRAKNEEMISILKGNLDVVVENRNELNEQLNPQSPASDQGGYAGNEEFDFDENTFLRDIQ